MNSDISKIDLFLRHAHLYFESKIMGFLKDYSGTANLLDYGCGNGEKSIKYGSARCIVKGIDISELSITEANRNKNEYCEYLIMDCEKTEFETSYFDVILDYGTFSSINTNIAFQEIIRILKPNGSLISIETFGHNPLINLKRKINVLRGKRTKWASDHIMKKNDWINLARSFQFVHIKYFGSVSYMFIPLIILIPEKVKSKFLNIIYKFDEYVSNLSFMNKLSFKTVVVLKNPLK